MTIFFYRTCLFIFCLCYCTFIYSYHVPGNVQSNDLSNIHEKLDDTFDAYVKGAMQDWSVPGMALGIIKDGQIVVAKGYSFRNINNPALVDENTVFPLASVTKSFTATLLAMLVNEKMLEWDDPVIKHLPEFQLCTPYLSNEITIRDLLCHRAGFERVDNLPYIPAICD